MAILALLIANISIQVGSSFAKTLFPAIGPMPTVLLRVSLAALMLVLFFRPWRRPLPRSGVKWLVLYGTCLGLMNCAFYAALQRVPLGICVAVEFTGPLTLAVLTSKKKSDWLWVIFAAIGIYLILPLGSEADSHLDLTGLALAVAAGIGWALYIVFGQKVSQHIEEPVAASLGLVVTTLVTLPIAMSSFSFDLISSQIWVTALGVALLASAVPYTLEMYALKRMSTTTFGIMMSLEPAFAALSGMLILKEWLTPAQWAAIVCIMVASAGSARSSMHGQDLAIAKDHN